MTPEQYLNLTAACFGIITGFLSLILSVIFFIAAKRAEKETSVALKEISEISKSLSVLSMKMLGRMTGALIDIAKPPVKGLELLTSEVKTESNDKELAKDETWDLPTTEQFRFDNLISSLYYCAIANLTNLGLLPQSINDLSTAHGSAQMVDLTYNDYHQLKRAIHAAKDFQKKLEASPNRYMYDSVVSVEENIKNVTGHYTSTVSDK